MINAYSVEITDRQSRISVDAQRLEVAVRKVLTESPFPEADISIALVDDREMHQLNVAYLDHDYPTDVLSFPLSREEGLLVGEIIVSVDTAERDAAENGLKGADELLLYVIHGLLHLVGYDDKNEQTRMVMREKEKHFMEKMGVSL